MNSELLKHLNSVNDVEIYSVFDDEFKTFGNVISHIDFSNWCDYMNNNTEIPSQGNVYYPSIAEMENMPPFEKVKNEFYGEMDIQVGYCNGRNSTYNGFEYHKCSEINVAVTDFCLVLGHTWQMKSNTFNVGDEKVFFVPKGTAIEMFQTTLHLSPCKISDDGFKGIVVLAKGTNTPLTSKPVDLSGENKILLQKNKWVIAHSERLPLINQGAFAGLIGENKEIKY